MSSATADGDGNGVAQSIDYDSWNSPFGQTLSQLAAAGAAEPILTEPLKNGAAVVWVPTDAPNQL
jgi:hypothetical protein